MAIKRNVTKDRKERERGIKWEHLNQTIERAAFVADRTIFFLEKKTQLKLSCIKE